ncbi:hypothetical protein NLI96_g550 [Meripilus lineatus]|uniref:Kinesin-like protein n=1 Tax=Meripilus lineatus TaxID=2056292 RepID=A0AAD5VC30_9APHY|nr:hypothetical protein NLI96_g550 [Physisporinus lineatus]
MSRLPRLLSEPEGHFSSSLSSSTSSLVDMNSLKRKATDDVSSEQPRKRLAPIPELKQPLQDTKNTNPSNIAFPKRSGIPPLTRPRAPTLTSTARRTQRATSAPPRSTIPITRAGPATRSTTAARRPIAGRAGPSNINKPEDKRFQSLQQQVTSIASNRAADVARFAADMDAERAKLSELQANHLVLSRELAAAKSHDLTRRRELEDRSEEIEQLKRTHADAILNLEMDLKRKERENVDLNDELKYCKNDLERERETVSTLKATISQQSTTQITLTTQNTALQAQVSSLQSALSDLGSQKSQVGLSLDSAMKRIAELEEENQAAERLRRKLHNMIQELKGNIRVFCRVFEPHSTQSEVFEEISLLAQSCADGYNVCVFAYGQTGSGKSFTMEGGSSESTAGMIPRAVERVFEATADLKTKGWEYRMEGQMLEIYNETINDLLGKGEFDKKKHDIKHDKSGRTTVTDVNVVPLSSPSQVRTLLTQAQSRRTVAATLMNERSSRSHSVFTLRIIGENTITGETCEGSLNLVDLAGSERLEKSGAANDKERLKETQAINKSLSALGDVIAALGEKGEGKGDKHIPYRNSKLTYLLQNSLSGNSKTLVNNTNIGTAKKQTRAANS